MVVIIVAMSLNLSSFKSNVWMPRTRFCCNGIGPILLKPLHSGRTELSHGLHFRATEVKHMLDKSVSFRCLSLKALARSSSPPALFHKAAKEEEKRRVYILEETSALNTKPCFCFSRSPTLVFFLPKDEGKKKTALLLFVSPSLCTLSSLCMLDFIGM